MVLVHDLAEKPFKIKEDMRRNNVILHIARSFSGVMTPPFNLRTLIDRNVSDTVKTHGHWCLEIKGELSGLLLS